MCRVSISRVLAPGYFPQGTGELRNMRGGPLVLLLVALAQLVSTEKLVGQAPWESPLLVGATNPAGWSVMAVDPGPGLGALVRWESLGRETRLGLRVGLGEDGKNGATLFGGVDVSSPLASYRDSERDPDVPLEVVWFSGVGVGIGDVTLLSIPLGLSLGTSLSADEVEFRPYLAPRLILDAWLNHPRREELDLAFAVDLGLELGLGGSWWIRFGASVGDRKGVGVGLGFGG